MKKSLVLTVLMLIIPLCGGAQEAIKKSGSSEKKSINTIKTGIPVQSQYSHNFKIRPYYFNRRIDVRGKGEILETELVLENLTDDPFEVYLFVIATYEKLDPPRSSFEMPMKRKELIRSFVPFPNNIENFTYNDPDKKGGTMLVKFPKNPKAGVNPETGKIYSVKENLLIRTYHLSKYRKNYFFFNNVTVLVFNSEGKPVYRQVFRLDGLRR